MGVDHRNNCLELENSHIVMVGGTLQSSRGNGFMGRTPMFPAEPNGLVCLPPAYSWNLLGQHRLTKSAHLRVPRV
ncbi:hypothetical protein DACRYDRAFT_110048 [Dacryopinax primogenitus]|uniref:Uncharacterized protein n=1 Tax=Dacryopinax primogenitus (strain DJM 731) TaxID=1858805 RepID=M5FUW8_DACPD|nr:uncharacterized protein DACRYDRAFT_110048 [Dacryopinax primogenitus]EJT99329.1 hypothetical protein DACRYDRAFT_110048 [Dacryopinax primogenitus]